MFFLHSNYLSNAWKFQGKILQNVTTKTIKFIIAILDIAIWARLFFTYLGSYTHIKRRVEVTPEVELFQYI